MSRAKYISRCGGIWSSAGGMMKTLQVAGVAIFALSAPAMAADVSAYGPPPLYGPIPPGAPWVGCYGGGNLGGVQGNANFNWTPDIAGFPISGPELTTYGQYTLHPAGVTGGAQVGCNYQTGVFAWGAEGDFGYTGLSASRNVTTINQQFTFPAIPPFNVAESVQSDFLATIRGRLGLISGAGGAWLFYITGGGAFANVRFSDSACFPLAEGGCNTDSATSVKFGWTAGAGVEWAFAPRWSAKAEYLFANLGNVNYISTNSIPSINPLATILHNHTLTENIGRIGVNWHFY